MFPQRPVIAFPIRAPYAHAPQPSRIVNITDDISATSQLLASVGDVRVHKPPVTTP